MRVLAIGPLLLVASCGARTPAPEQDWGPPSEPVDPVGCPAARLEQFAATVGAPIKITTEPVVDAARIDKIPCKPDETDAACIGRARQLPVPALYELAGVTIGGDGNVELVYDVDGRRYTDRGPALDVMIARLKQLQAAGHKVTVIRGGRSGDAESRHAAIAYRGVGGSQHRVGTLTWTPPDSATTMADAHAAAERERLDIRRMALDGSQLAIVVTCLP